MKTIEIHPLSAALGATFVGLILITLGFSPVVSSCSSSSPGGTTTTTGFGGGEEPYDVTVLNDLTIESMPSVDISTLSSIRVKGIPTHEDFVVIDSETPYTVPVDKVLVPTGIVRVIVGEGPTTVVVKFDGVDQMQAKLQGWRILYYTNAGPGLMDDGTADIPLGLHAASGVIVDLSSDEAAGSFRLLGYLEEA